MHTSQSVHGIANGRWEHSEPRLPKVLAHARIGVAKALKTLSERLVESVEVARTLHVESDEEQSHAAE